MSGTVWDDQAQYLNQSREFMWNPDYLEFLAEKVWRLTEPVDVIDFGCGIGFLGELLLPILPDGSTYTGVDWSTTLLEKAKENLRQYGDRVGLLQADVTEFKPARQYDLAICQTLLQHVPDSFRVIDTMRDSVVEGGLVICCEISANLSNGSLFFEGLDHDELGNLGILQKLWVNDRKRLGTDRNIGVKIPAYMTKIGLRDVDIRCSDYMRFVSPRQEPGYHSRNVAEVMDSWAGTAADRNKMIGSLLERGLTAAEAEQQYHCERTIRDYITANGSTDCMLIPLFLLISYGYR